jgi:hypothetical protein
MTFGRVQVNQAGLKLNGALHLLVYVVNVNILGGSVCTIKKNTEALEAASEENGPEVNADKAKYMVMSRDHSAVRGHNINIDDSSLERVEEFKYLGTTLLHQKSIQEKLRAD